MKIASLRAPKTLAELRAQHEDFDLDVKVKFRKRDLPTAWEDVNKETSKSWKSRKAQHQFQK